MNSQSKYSIAVTMLALASCAVLFQNCSAAPPPDISSLTQPSTSGQPGGPAGNPDPTRPTPGATPIPTPNPIPGATPKPRTAPATQTYSWNVGAFSSCNSGLRTRSVTCINSVGTVVSNAFCETAMPASSQACSSYICTATLAPPSEFFPSGFCTYTCVGAATYYGFANDPAQCSPNPIGVAGTEMFYLSDYSQQIARPFTQCTITRNFSNTVNGYTGDSYCE